MTRNALTGLLVTIGAILAFNQVDGWGWFLFIAFILRLD